MIVEDGTCLCIASRVGDVSLKSVEVGEVYKFSCGKAYGDHLTCFIIETPGGVTVLSGVDGFSKHFRVQTA